MNLVFQPFEVVGAGLATLVTAIIFLDGESHWFEGSSCSRCTRWWRWGPTFSIDLAKQPSS